MRLKELIFIDAREGKLHDIADYQFKTFSELNKDWRSSNTNELSCTQHPGYSVKSAIKQVKKLYASHYRIGKKLKQSFTPIALRLDNYAVNLLVSINN